MKFPVWHVAQTDCAAVERLTDAGYPYLVSSVLASRGVSCPEQATEFLTQETTLVHSPFLMKDGQGRGACAAGDRGRREDRRVRRL